MNYAYAVFDNEKNTYSDWGLMLESVSIPLPDPQIVTLQIPGRNGALDLSEVLTGSVNYNNRVVSLRFSALNSYDEWASLVSQVSSYLHGRLRKMVLDIDTGFYYYGRFSVDSSKSDEATSTIVITAVVDPYKYELDPVEFTKLIVTSEEVVLVGLRMPVVPVINSSAIMTVTFDEVVYNLAVGDNIIPDINFIEGDNTLLFTGTGTIIITYQRGTF